MWVRCQELSPLGSDEDHDLGHGQFGVVGDDAGSDEGGELFVRGEFGVVLLCVLDECVDVTLVCTDLLRASHLLKK